MYRTLFFVALLLFSYTVYSQVSFEWAKRFGGTQQDIGNSIIFDLSGNTYSTGSFSATVDFDPNSGVFNLSAIGNSDIFITKLDINGDFVWAKSIGGNGHEVANDIFLDSNKNIYLTGYFSGTADFDPDSNAFNLTSNGNRDIFVCKLDSLGDFVWARSFGGSDRDEASSIVVDQFGNVYVTGYYKNTVDFDPGSGTFNLTSAGDEDSFVLKLNASGNFVWAGSIGGAYADDKGKDIVIDQTGNVYSIGYFRGTCDFDPGPGTYNITTDQFFAGINDLSDVYLSKLDSSGNFVWAFNLGNISFDEGTSLILDAFENIIITGFYEGPMDCDPDSNAVFNVRQTRWGHDVFVAKYDNTSDFKWARAIGSGTANWAGFELSNSVFTDINGSVYTVGYYTGDSIYLNPDSSSHILPRKGASDMFISKLDSAGNFVWGYRFGSDNDPLGNLNEDCHTIKVDLHGNIYAIGYFNDTVDFNVTSGVHNLVSNGNKDVFILKMSQPNTVGITDRNIVSKNLIVYPNPSSDVLYLDFEDPIHEVLIYSISGKLVLRETSKQISIQSLPRGQYIIQVRTKEDIINHQFIKN